MTDKQEYIIIVAGGKGLRMGSDIPKQFLPVGGLPVLMHTIKRFRAYSKQINIILVLPESQQEYWRELCSKYSFNEPHCIANGGQTRFHSVKNGLALVPDAAEGVVGVHDGVRPFASVETISRCFDMAQKTHAVVPVVPVVETLRHLRPKATDGSATDSHPDGSGVSETVSRSDYRLVQTPQTFDIQLLKEAYRQQYTDFFTDDASVVESMGKSIALVEGNRENIKITTPFDLAVAEMLVAKQK
jgi:2-C-methyl-D-erythritol 4-phosphate cytidylyltransferase